MSSSSYKTDSNYRYYLCIEKINIYNSWECIKSDSISELNAFDIMERTKIVKINKYVPKLLDRVFIVNTLQPYVKVHN
jgi:hypothetical protein